MHHCSVAAQFQANMRPEGRTIEQEVWPPWRGHERRLQRLLHAITGDEQVCAARECEVPVDLCMRLESNMAHADCGPELTAFVTSPPQNRDNRWERSDLCESSSSPLP